MNKLQSIKIMFFLYIPETNQAITPPTAGTARVVIYPSLFIAATLYSGLAEEKLIQWSRQFCGPARGFIDAGAHTGTYTTALARDAKYTLAFEPQRETFYGLCGSVALSGLSARVHCLNLALGARRESAVLNIVSPDGGGSTLISPTDDCAILGTELVEVVPLDDYKLEDVGLIKMDVEGSEHSVLVGAEDTILRCRPHILFEVNGAEIDPNIEHFFCVLNYTLHKVWHNMYLAAPIQPL